MKSNPYDTLTDLIGDVEKWAYHSGKAPTLMAYGRYDKKLAKAKSRAFAIIDKLNK